MARRFIGDAVVSIGRLGHRERGTVHENGDVRGGNSVKCENVQGNVHAGNSVKCGNVGGSCSAGNSISRR